MNWEEFLRQKAIELSLSEELLDTLLAIFPEPVRSLTIKELAYKLKISPSSVKNHRLKPIYAEFHIVGKGRGKLKRLRQKLGQEFHQGYSVPDSGTDSNEDSSGILFKSPRFEFKNLIESHIVDFVGREFIFDNFFEFTRQKDRGYFTIIGTGGSGKTSIAANFVYQYSKNTLVYFCETSRESFLDSVKYQASLRYPSLQFNDINDINALLSLISENLNADNKIFLVIDFLYEHKKSADHNILDLPRYLPSKVYCLLLRKPYNLETKKLFTESPTKTIDLHNHRNETQEDMGKYLQNILNPDTDFFDTEFKEIFAKYLRQKNKNREQLIEEFTSSAGDSFAHLKCKIKDVKKHKKISFASLPEGLYEYYMRTHIDPMNIKCSNTKINVIKILIEKNNQFVVLGDLARHLDQDEFEIYKIALEWSEYLLTNTKNGNITSFKIRDSILFSILESRKEILR